MFGPLNRFRQYLAGRPGEDEDNEYSGDPADLAPEEGPRAAPRWATALQAAGATMQDMQTARDGGQGTALQRFTSAQERLRGQRQEAQRASRRFQQLRNSVPASDTQFWNAYALGGEEAAMNVLQTRSNRAYQDGVREDTQAFTANQNQLGRDLTRQEGAADRAFRGREGALDRGLRISEGNADRDVQRSEGEANRRAQMEARLNTAVVANARAATGLGPTEPLTQEARELVRQQISRENISTSDLLLMANLGYLSDEDLKQRLGLNSGGQLGLDTGALDAALSQQ